MLRNLGLAALVLTLAGSVPTAEETQPPPAKPAPRPHKPILLTVRATLENVLTSDQLQNPDRSAVKLEFLKARPRQTQKGQREETLDAIRLNCLGVVEHYPTSFRYGTRYCLYARPESPDFDLCNVHRWKLAQDPHCDPPLSDDPRMFCIPTGGPCGDNDEPQQADAAEEADRDSYLWKGPTVQEMAVSQAKNLGLDANDASGGYMQMGGVLVGRAPRAETFADVNRDGLLDRVVVRAGTLELVVYFALPDGGTKEISRLVLERSACRLAVTDFNEDAHEDVGIKFCDPEGNAEDRWTILVGDGKGIFTPDTEN